MSPRDPEELVAAGSPSRAEIAPSTRMGTVHLGVADLGRSIAYYETELGLRVHEREASRASLGTGGEDLLELAEEPGARPVRGYTGLYHFALLVPERDDLARFLAHAARDGIALAGLADHFVSEAIYLRDPDEHGIEVYWDRPRETWEGRVGEKLTTLPLDVDDLLGELGDPASAPFDGLPEGTAMGHVHLRVADVAETIAFYRDVLGFALMATFGRQAAFLAAGGYHHDIGANVWESAGAPPAPPGYATLEQMTIVAPSEAARDAALDRAQAAGLEPGDDGLLRDPSGNPVLVTA